MTTEGVDPKDQHLQLANRGLQDGLKACNELVADLRIKLAANSNEPLGNNEDGFAGSGDPNG